MKALGKSSKGPSLDCFAHFLYGLSPKADYYQHGLPCWCFSIPGGGLK